VARHVKPGEYAARRRAILDVALRLMHDKGYERMTIQDVLTELEMSKGALYHYFDSKQALLEGIVESMSDSGSTILQVVVEDPGRNAIEKLHAYFESSTTWKAQNRTAVQTAMRLWHDENNALLRHKLSQDAMRSTTPVLEAIIRQGCDEGAFDTGHPHEAAIIITGMGLHLADAIIDAMDKDGSDGIDVSGSNAQSVIAAYTDAFERILGAPSGSLALRSWAAHGAAHASPPEATQ
jgi:AcrR family transcriptional regulator